MYKPLAARRGSSSASSDGSSSELEPEPAWTTAAKQQLLGSDEKQQHDSDSDSDARPAAHGRKSSTASARSCSGMTADETRALWRCMLALQRRYGCYNSTRIDLAVQHDDDGLMPNRFIIDTLNRSVVDLPPDGRRMLDAYLLPPRETAAAPPAKTRPRLRFWPARR
ncbi:hypothetical protein CDD83_1890 [Cordyceps sp. RAO-2017]|nr:hypothetical protein CDD83_1890 [Cordyceps sp. RAO-2017]